MKTKMKTINLLLIFLCYSMNAICQEKMETMQLSIPKDAVKIDESRLKMLSHERFSDERAAAFHNHIYIEDGLLIYYLNLSQFPSHPERRHSLEDNQKMTVALLSGKSELKGDVYVIDYSKIITINNIKFSIIKYHQGDNMTIKFTSDYSNSGRFINGFIEYKETDDAEAQQYLSDFLGSMHFKE